MNKRKLSCERISTLSALGLLAAVLPGGCAGQSGAEVVEGPGVGPGPGGAVECVQDVECRQLADDRLARLAVSAPRQAELSASRCESVNVVLDTGSVSGPSCECDLGDAGTRTVGPSGIGCSVLGRGGDCLFGDPDFAGCAPTDATSCETTCQQLAGRLVDDAARVFQTEVLSASCNEGSCDTVVAIDGQCFVNQSESYGRGYDCSLGTDELLEAEQEAVLGVLANPVPVPPGSYVAGTQGTFWLTVNSGFSAGTVEYEPSFSASAQFATITGEDGGFGTVIDPLDGIDDCGVIARANTGFAPSVDFFAVDEVAVSDALNSYPLALNSAANDRFFPYGVSLSEMGVQPRFSQPYTLTARGGQLAGELRIDNIVLPADLAVPSLEGVSRLERGPIELSWTGTGSEPLSLQLWVKPGLGDGAAYYEIECLMADDGAFTVPSDVILAAPEGIASASFHREHRALRTSGDNTLLTLASVDVSHSFALGGQCDGAAVMAACEQYAEVQRQVYAECGVQEVPSLASTCPAYLAESCQGCVEYFECASSGLRCDEQGLFSASGCGCP